MNPTSLRQIAQWCGGRLVQGRPADTVAEVSTDTRGLSGGELFVALKGERFDAHDFIDQASESGVAAILVSSLNLATQRYEGGIIHARDVLVALQELALHYRRSLPDLFVVGVTGSNGKTSTKDFLTAVLSQRGEVSATLGNLNNHIGLPLTILRAETEHKAAVWEMGMNHPGEIEVLAEIAAPNAGVITNVGTAHIEHMVTREAIAEEKGKLAEAIGADGFVVLKANDHMTDAIAARCVCRVVRAGIEAGDVSAHGLRPTAKGIAFDLSAEGETVSVELPVPGEHMVANAVLAAATGLQRGVSLMQIAEALANVTLSGGRLERRAIRGVDFLDDSYNANPDSMRAALDTLMSVGEGGRRLAVLGRMAELGEHEETEHRALGQAAAEVGVDAVIAVGDVAKLIAEGAAEGVGSVVCAADQEEAANRIKEIANAGDCVLVKGSRSSAMEKVIEIFAEMEGGTELMLYHLHQFAEQLDGLNVFRYGTFRSAGAALTAFLLCVIFGEKLILRLTALKIGQPIRTAEEVHKLAELHGGKGGTPTMGGIMIVGSVVLATLLWAVPTNPFICTLLMVTVGTGLLGFFDDYLKVTRKTSAGVSGRVKLVAQFGIAFAAVLYLYLQPDTSEFIRQLHVPFLKYPIIDDMGFFAVLLLPVVVVGCSNAVNLTDGLDGLATGCTLTTAAAYTIFSYVAGNSVAANYLFLPHHPQVGEVAIFCAALLGAGLGFLWFNCHPARVFMGDTGSLSIGGMLGMIAICCKQEILLVIIGGVFVAEAGSVILQVASFKMTGKRIFKMAPLHHHFELMGWKESKVITRFWIVSIICALVGVATMKLR